MGGTVGVTIVRMLPEEAVRRGTDVVSRGSRVTLARRLQLGGWHVHHAVDVGETGGHTQRMVLRRWARPGWDADDPDYTVEREPGCSTCCARRKFPPRPW